MEARLLRIIVFLLFFPVWVQAQEMVTQVGNEGLEKTVSYNVASFTDIRDKKLEDVMRKMPGITVIIFEGSSSFSYIGSKCLWYSIAHLHKREIRR